jgi:hypothetical protein
MALEGAATRRRGRRGRQYERALRVEFAVKLAALEHADQIGNGVRHGKGSGNGGVGPSATTGMRSEVQILHG